MAAPPGPLLAGPPNLFVCLCFLPTPLSAQLYHTSRAFHPLAIPCERSPGQSAPHPVRSPIQPFSLSAGYHTRLALPLPHFMPAQHSARARCKSFVVNLSVARWHTGEAQRPGTGEARDRRGKCCETAGRKGEGNVAGRRAVLLLAVCAPCAAAAPSPALLSGPSQRAPPVASVCLLVWGRRECTGLAPARVWCHIWPAFQALDDVSEAASSPSPSL